MNEIEYEWLRLVIIEATRWGSIRSGNPNRNHLTVRWIFANFKILITKETKQHSRVEMNHFIDLLSKEELEHVHELESFYFQYFFWNILPMLTRG